MSSFFRLDITFVWELYCHLGMKMKKNMTIVLFFSLTARANVMANLTSLNNLPNTRVFVAAENGSVEVLELVAFFSLKTGTFKW